MDLTEKQQEAINEIEHNLQIIACAGSGKTEVITRRIAKILKERKDIEPKNIVAFTFTEKAAESMKKRIEKAIDEEIDISEMYIGTIHSFCYRLLKERSEAFAKFKVLDSVKNYLFVKRYYKACGMNDLDLKNYPFNIKLFLNCIDKLIYEYDNRDKWEKQNIEVFNKYKDCLYSKRYFDFSFLIFETLQQIKNNPELLSEIKYLVVDEYQDVDDLQERLINCFYNTGCNLCVVGDDDQTIYRFRR